MSEKECRICYLEEIISPCLCNGTGKWVHRECLEIWRAVNRLLRVLSTTRIHRALPGRYSL